MEANGLQNKDDTVSIAGNDEIMSSEDDTEIHPFFTVGLPRDFATNPIMLAMASLLEDDNNDSKAAVSGKGSMGKTATGNLPLSPCTTNAVGGGKVRKVSSRKSRQTDPYCIPSSISSSSPKKESDATTVGEASLFLKMWKL